MPKAVQPKDNAEKSAHVVELKFGYEDREAPETMHRRVRFGRRPTAADFIKSAEECGGSDLQFALALAQSAIIEFGQLPMPVPLTVLLSLNQIDREKLTAAYFLFLGATGGENGEILDGGKVRLGTGFERNNKKIVDVTFGKLLNGYDEIEIERQAEGLWHGNALRMTKEITAPQDLTLAEIQSLDVDDFTLLRNAEEQWLNSFRGD
jgi:hypothetical protein